jgi:hypothetical protein
MNIPRTLLSLDPKVRYVAVNQRGAIEEMVQSESHPSLNPPDTDRMEELIVNPVALELFARRGNLDLGGVDFLVVRYGLQFQLILPWRAGHVSIGIEADGNPLAIAERAVALLSS